MIGAKNEIDGANIETPGATRFASRRSLSMRLLSILALVGGCGGGSTCSLVGNWTGTDSHEMPLTIAFSADGTLQWLEGGMLTTGTWHGTLVQLDESSSDDSGGQGQVSILSDCRALSLGTNGPLLSRVSDTPLVGLTCFSMKSSSCYCTMGPQASLTPASCDDSIAPGSICCADAGWPSQAGNCECAPLLCQTFPLGSGMNCGCWWGQAGIGGVAPDAACSGSSVCCLANDGSSCTCYSSSSTDCSQSSAHKVPSCNDVDFPPSCAEGTKTDRCTS
jgi:hypothetical protein